MAGGAYIIIALFFGLAGGVVGRLKGSSFLIWFLISGLIPVIGLLTALVYRMERDEPMRRCPRCTKVVPLADALCTRCGQELAWVEPDERVALER